ncbi:hypothetical protein Pint_31272 [Pistacia integerrima]|uniref:Uncharacterized protein n=1 Tax=Pistacia integerrima TaxID=434235 RepID=A0ACC0XRZ6_9ROSI|nr:hypothetical protein Pint_31272 [Pistacia integerrima]
MSNFKLESCTVETSDGVKLHARVFKPSDEKDSKDDNLVIVLVHPYSVLGGCQGLLKGIASGLAGKGYRAVTFDMRCVGKSTGRASLTGFAEVKDVVAVCKWVCENLSTDRILLVGSSAGYILMDELLDLVDNARSMLELGEVEFRSLGAPIAGSAVQEIPQVVGYVSLGYPFGILASILFGRHHKNILETPKPKLFVMGTRDGFTSVKQLKNKLSSAEGRVETHLIEGVSHFQMEGPEYDAKMVTLILEFIASL